MIIDLIQNRQDNEKNYNAKIFYNNVMQYYDIFSEIVSPIATALDSGEEEDIKIELIKYIINNDYNLKFINYILKVKWLNN